MNVDRLIGLVGLAFAVLSLAYAFYVYRKGQQAKLLWVSVAAPFPIQVPLWAPRGSGFEIWRVFVLLWNRGHEAIEASDFVSPIVARVPDGKLLLAGIEARDALARAELFVAPASLPELKLSLLRPREAVVLFFDLPAASPGLSLDIQMKSLSSVRSQNSARDFTSVVSTFYTFAVLAGGILFYDAITSTLETLLQVDKRLVLLAAFVALVLCAFVGRALIERVGSAFSARHSLVVRTFRSNEALLAESSNLFSKAKEAASFAPYLRK
jgi:hypothetical protein